LLDPVVRLLHELLLVLAPVLPGPPGVEIALALVAVTFAVRAALFPLALKSFRVQRQRAGLAPELDRLRRLHASDRARLAREIGAAHQRSGISPFAGFGSLLVQMPVLAAAFRLVTVVSIGGRPNAIVTANVLGTPLASHWLPVLAGAGVVSGQAAVFTVVVLAFLALALVTVRQQRDAPLLMRLMPFGTVVTAAILPVAVTVYLLSTTLWTVAERAALTRVG
jgi:YidC/Oxa1 family membrane protein insertase